MTHDYKRHGTTTLFAALNVLEGTVIGRCMQRHRHEEFNGLVAAMGAVLPWLIVNASRDRRAEYFPGT